MHNFLESLEYRPRNHPDVVPVSCNPETGWSEGVGAFQEMYLEKSQLLNAGLPISHLLVDGVELYISSLPINHNAPAAITGRDDVVGSSGLLHAAANNDNVIVNLYGDRETTPYLKEVANNRTVARASDQRTTVEMMATRQQPMGAISSLQVHSGSVGGPRIVNVLHELAWPDYGTIPLTALVELMHMIDSQIQTANAEHGRSSTPLIHCLAGAGRSGTVAAAYVLSQKTDYLQTLSLPAARDYLATIIVELKDQRSSLLVEVEPQIELLIDYLNYLRNPGVQVARTS